MRNLKKIKFTNNIKTLSSKIKWVFFSEMQDYKLTSDYIDFICPDPNNEGNATEKLNSMIKESLIKEFSQDIRNTKSFDILVDAVAHNLKKKDLNN